MSVEPSVQAIRIELPEDALPPIAGSPDDFAREMRLAAAMLWYLRGRISHERAAQYAGISRIALIDALAAAKRPAFHVDVDEIIEEVRDAREALGQHLAPMHEDESMSPGEIARTLAAMDEVEPFEMTDEEAAAIEVDRHARQVWETARFVELADRLGGSWE